MPEPRRGLDGVLARLAVDAQPVGPFHRAGDYEAGDGKPEPATAVLAEQPQQQVQQHRAAGEAERDVDGRRQRLVPLADRVERGVDHARRERGSSTHSDGEGSDRDQHRRRAPGRSSRSPATRPGHRSRPPSRPRATATTCATARRRARPARAARGARWRTRRPAVMRTKASAKPTKPSQRSAVHATSPAAERKPDQQPVARAGGRREQDDRIGWMHVISATACGRPRRTGARSTRWLGHGRNGGGSGRAAGRAAVVAPGPRRQVLVDRLVAELGQQVEAAALRHQLRDGAVRIAQVAEVARARRAGAHAGGNAVLRRRCLVIDAVDAQRALLHHAVAVVVLARAVRAGPGAQLAADAGVGIDQHDAVLGALEGGAGRADGDAGRLLAMQARAREMHGAARGTFADLVARARG